MSCFTDRLGIGSIVSLTLREGLHISLRDHPDLMAQLAYFTTAKMSAAKGFHDDPTMAHRCRGDGYSIKALLKSNEQKSAKRLGFSSLRMLAIPLDYLISRPVQYE